MNEGEVIAKAVVGYLGEKPDSVFSILKVVKVIAETLDIKVKKVSSVINALIASGEVDGVVGKYVRCKQEAEEEANDKETQEMAGAMFDGNKFVPIPEGVHIPLPAGFSDMKESAYKSEAERLRKEIEAYKLNIAELGKKIQTEKLAGEELVKRLEKELESAKGQTRVVTVQLLRDKKKVKVIDALFHTQFERVLTLAQAGMNIFVYGPTGCGKSHLCKQVAEALDRRYAFVSCTAGMGEATLGGRLLPIGKGNSMTYVVSEFIDCFENGGVFLLDEMDAADPNVLLLINSALANGKVAVTNRSSKPYAERHEDFVCIAAANTVGTGADRMYSGRNKLDASTLDRFSIGKVFMDYDQQLEEKLCPDDVLRNVLLSYRKKIEANRLERAMSTRFMRDAYIMKSEHDYTLEDINEAYFLGWRQDEQSKVVLPAFMEKRTPEEKNAQFAQAYGARGNKKTL